MEKNPTLPEDYGAVTSDYLLPKVFLSDTRWSLSDPFHPEAPSVEFHEFYPLLTSFVAAILRNL